MLSLSRQSFVTHHIFALSILIGGCAHQNVRAKLADCEKTIKGNFFESKFQETLEFKSDSAALYSPAGNRSTGRLKKICMDSTLSTAVEFDFEDEKDLVYILVPMMDANGEIFKLMGVRNYGVATDHDSNWKPVREIKSVEFVRGQE